MKGQTNLWKSDKLFQITLRNGLTGAPEPGFKIDFLLHRNGNPLSLKELMPSPGVKKSRRFECTIEWNSKIQNINGICGDTALWLPTGDGFGLKIILNGTEVQLQNLYYIQECQSSIFPQIEWAAQGVLKSATESYPCVVARMEEVKVLPPAPSPNRWVAKLGDFARRLKQIPGPVKEEFPGTNALLQCPPSIADSCVREFSRWKLLPEDDWHKPTNLIDGKIVDCQNFEFMPHRYAFPVGKASLADLRQLYLTRPRSVRKGILYQGFKFANGYSMPGYSSDGIEFDSYRKIPFLPLGKAKNGRVLDLGCNQGFFSFQSAIHGATEVIAVDGHTESLDFARRLNETCFGFNQINFVETDIERVVMENRYGKFDLILLLSVLHEMYPNMKGSDNFLATLASMARFIAFETAVAHPQMSLTLHEIFARLAKHFSKVRLLYVYDAYSSGFRAIFVCYGLEWLNKNFSHSNV